ncbi:hypothetical protein PFISCL1PPCAC_21896, partial [Pristionchus fissidentatus]
MESVLTHLPLKGKLALNATSSRLHSIASSRIVCHISSLSLFKMHNKLHVSLSLVDIESSRRLSHLYAKAERTWTRSKEDK